MKQVLLLLMSFQFTFGISQTKISGTITDDFGVVTYANIKNLNSKLGTTSDKNGNFNLKVNLKDTIFISRVGYNPKTIIITSLLRKNIKLEMESIFDEVLIETSIKRGESIALNCHAACKYTCCCEVYGVEIQRLDSANNDSNKFLLFPNPSKSGVFTLKNNDKPKKLTIHVMSTSGRMLLSKEYQALNAKIKIDLANFSNGLYLINIINDGKIIETKRAIISDK